MIPKSSRRLGLVRVALLALCLPGLVPPAIAAAPAGAVWNRPADIAAINAIETRMADSSQADRLADVVSDNAVLVDGYVPAVKRGKAEILRAYVQHKQILGASKGRYSEISIISTPNFACSASQIRYEVTQPGGARTPTELRKLDVFKKIGGRWQLVQQHISAAIDRQSGLVTSEKLPVRGALTWNAASFSKTAIDPEAARKGIVDWTDRALREVGLQSAMQFFAPGEDVLLYGEYNPGNIRTRAEVTAYYGPLYNSFSGLHVKSPLYEVDSDGLLGAQIDTQDIVIDMNDGSRPRLSIRQSDCLRQYDGKWQTFMEMVSFPVDPATGKAVKLSPGFKPR